MIFSSLIIFIKVMGHAAFEEALFVLRLHMSKLFCKILKCIFLFRCAKEH